MVGVSFAKAFCRHVDCPDLAVPAGTLRDVVDAYFAEYPAVRSYVLDDAGAVRRHVAMFHNDDLVTDRSGLTDAFDDGDRLHVFQALSGGCT